MGASAPVKYHYFHRFFTYSMRRSWASRPTFWIQGPPPGGRSESKTASGGEFGWGGTSVKR